MKKTNKQMIITLFVICCLWVSPSLYGQERGQNLRLKGYISYAFSDRIESYYNDYDYYRGTLKGGAMWGGGIEYMLQKNYGIELFYKHITSTMPAIYATGNSPLTETVFDFSMNNIMLSSTRYLQINNLFEPYFGLFGGASIFHIDNRDNGRKSNSVKFGYGARVGSHIWLSEKVGFNLQVELTSAAQSFGGGISIGSGGISPGVSASSSMYQFQVGGGIVVKL